MNRFRQVFYSLLFFCLIVVTIIKQTTMYNKLHVYMYKRYDSDDLRTVLGDNSKSIAEDNHNIIRILSWTQRYSFQDNWFSLNITGPEAFSKCNFPPDILCDYTTDKKDYDRSNAVLFRARRIRDLSELPPRRQLSHKWLFLENEPPPKVWSRIPQSVTEGIRHLFNLTSTYASDSDIPVRSLMQCRIDEGLYNYYKDVNFGSHKQKLVAWFVSHCPTSSGREEYVKELQKYVQVDIYGECGPLKCGAQSDAMNELNIECDDNLLNNTYKFYLSFENSLCENYVTEKLWRLFLRRVNIVPIVMGYENYTRLMPKGSFVDVRDFESPRDLADFLQRADHDHLFYNSFARKKNALVCKTPMEDLFECKLCRYLHKNKGKTQIASDVVEYWSEKNKCKTLEEFLPQLQHQIEEKNENIPYF